MFSKVEHLRRLALINRDDRYYVDQTVSKLTLLLIKAKIKDNKQMSDYIFNVIKHVKYLTQ